MDPSLLGMLLFIITEVMVFGAFFTAYFFIRVVQGADWPAEGTELPKLIAGVNTAILISSSFTLHWAEHAHKMGNRRGLQAGILTTFLLGCTFLFIQINEYVHLGFSPQDHAQGTIFYGLTGLHGAHVFIGLTLLLFVDDPRVPRPLHGGGPPGHRGAGDLLALRRRDVDRRLHDGLHPLGRGEPAALGGGGVPAAAVRDRRRGRRGRARAGDPRALSAPRHTEGRWRS